MKNNLEYKRCAICDYCDFDDTVTARNFILDPSTQDYHCSECAKAIQGTVEDDEFEEGRDWSKGPSTPYWKRRPFKKGNQSRPKSPGVTLPELTEPAVAPNLELLDPIYDEGSLDIDETE